MTPARQIFAGKGVVICFEPVAALGYRHVDRIDGEKVGDSATLSGAKRLVAEARRARSRSRRLRGHR